MDQALILCRWLHYGSAMVLFGTAVFQIGLSTARLSATLETRLRPVLAAAAAIALLTALAWLFLLSGELAGDWQDVWTPGTWYAVLRDTDFGAVWSLRLVIIVLLCGLVFVRRRWARQVSAFLAALFLASLGLVGHAVLLDGAKGWINRLCQVTHLLAAGFWLGTLIPLLFCFRRFSDPSLRADASTALRRFSGYGHLAVAVVIATGMVNVWLVLGRWPVDLSSPYQRLLDAKIMLVVIMVGLALANRYVFVPRLKESRMALDRLRLFTATEIILGALVVALVSVFGTLAPQ